MNIRTAFRILSFSAIAALAAGCGGKLNEAEKVGIINNPNNPTGAAVRNPQPTQPAPILSAEPK